MISNCQQTTTYTNFRYPIYLGQNPAPKVGSELVYTCPKDHLFEHDLYAPRQSTIRCGEDGIFSKPPFWPKCIIREYIEYYKNNSIHICKDIISAVFTTPSTEDPCPSGNCSEYEKIFCYIHLLHISNSQIWQKVGAIV